MERKEALREGAGGATVDRVSEVEDVIEEFIWEERKSIDLRRGGGREMRSARGDSRASSTYLVSHPITVLFLDTALYQCSVCLIQS